MGVPYARGSDTSRAAAESIEGSVGGMKAQVLALYTDADLTCDEVEEALDMKHQTASARVYDLRKLGLLRDSGERRATRSGRKAVVWTQTKADPVRAVGGRKGARW